MARSTARAAAMQMIYEHLLGGEGGEDTLLMVYENLIEQEGVTNPSKDDQAYIADVLGGVIQHLGELDQEIEAYSVDWPIDRMAKVDLTILRLAAYEILYRKDVPGSVAINEAVELANHYSEPASSRFINGVLGALLRAAQKE